MKYLYRSSFTIGLACAAVLAAAGLPSRAAMAAESLAPPFRVEADRRPIDTGGFAAPFAADFDGDGSFDLLVGQRGDCKLNIYRNRGVRGRPEFAPAVTFRAGGVEATLPGG